MAVPDGIDTVTRYNATARTFHAILALLVIVNLALGLLQERLEDTVNLTPLHMSIGLTVLALTLARIAWRLTWKTPDYVPALRRFDAIVARTMHGLFYGLMLILPLTGWIMTSAGKPPLEWFGIEVPKLAVEKGSTLYEIGHEGHEILGFVMLALVVLHVGAALRHHFILKDGVLRRIWW